MGIMTRDGILIYYVEVGTEMTSLLETGPRHVSFHMGVIALMD